MEHGDLCDSVDSRHMFRVGSTYLDVFFADEGSVVVGRTDGVTVVRNPVRLDG